MHCERYNTASTMLRTLRNELVECTESAVEVWRWTGRGSERMSTSPCQWKSSLAPSNKLKRDVRDLLYGLVTDKVAWSESFTYRTTLRRSSRNLTRSG